MLPMRWAAPSGRIAYGASPVRTSCGHFRSRDKAYFEAEAQELFTMVILPSGRRVLLILCHLSIVSGLN